MIRKLVIATALLGALALAGTAGFAAHHEEAENPCAENPCAENPCAENPCAEEDNPCGGDE
jgi:uncharacterized low-complexity protein